MHITKRNSDLLKKLSLKDKKDIIRKALKLTEETGEVAEAVLSSEYSFGCEYKGKTKADVVEEVTDVIIVGFSILHHLASDLGEEVLKDIFNPGFLFHIYDTNQNEIGYSDQQVFSLLKKNAIYNKNKVKEYEIKQNFTFWFNEYIITCLVDKPTIKPEIIIYLTTIEDAIIDAKKKKK